MDPVMNPFRPGAGRRPPLLAGRERELAAFDVARRRCEERGEGERPWVIHGLRGVGKTVLLGELLAQVTSRGWIAAKVEVAAGRPLPQALAHELQRALRTATGRHEPGRLRRVLAVFSAFSLTVDPTGGLSVGLDIDPERGTADSGDLALDLLELFEVLGESARDLGVGVLVLIDELQEATGQELRALNTAVHRLGQGLTPLPVLVIGAGLPSLPPLLAEATSYAERLYDYRAIGALEEDGARQALTGPAADLDVRWDHSALQLTLDSARGYPYFLQAAGKHVWDEAVRSPISVEDAELGVAAARAEIDDGLYRARWERATPVQRQLLRALAQIGGSEPAAVSDLAHALGKKSARGISVARDEVLRKGLVYVPERGFLRFSVPGMDDFIARQD
ncbi:ATP-binding protein [Phycicoccus sp. SLBN-51]|uniref:ATP-binding protein n=1 Tax=Phycicoccus sp. SLBN-51 TaxID=2768447 RepID=UPI001152C26E|nr:ATP-binding protein [Phycicoccus sp. SLBN-51]